MVAYIFKKSHNGNNKNLNGNLEKQDQTASSKQNKTAINRREKIKLTESPTCLHINLGLPGPSGSWQGMGKGLSRRNRKA